MLSGIRLWVKDKIGRDVVYLGIYVCVFLEKVVVINVVIGRMLFYGDLNGMFN